MGKYYYLVAGLPNLTFDGYKPPYAVLEFKAMMAEHLTSADAHLLDVFRLKVESDNLLRQLQSPDSDLAEGGIITAGELNELITGVQAEYDSKNRLAAYKIQRIQELKEEKEGDYYDSIYHKKPKQKIKVTIFRNKNKRLPVYFEPFVRTYLKSVEQGEAIIIPWEDRLSALYYEHVMKCSNNLMALWFELNLNINNIYTALTCRKHQLDTTQFIVGNTKVSNKLRTSIARDFDLGETLPYMQAVIRIAEDPDWQQREWRTDQLKWEWLDEQNFPKVFDFENVLTYWLKIGMLERWSSLDKAEGDKAFRQLVGVMKESSGQVLDEFKRNNKK